MKSKQLFIGLISEGTTDTRFLYYVIDRTIKELIFSFGGSIEIYINTSLKTSSRNLSKIKE